MPYTRVGGGSETELIRRSRESHEWKRLKRRIGGERDVRRDKYTFYILRRMMRAAPA